MGATVSGYSLPPTTSPSLYRLTQIDQSFADDIGDIRDAIKLQRKIEQTRPDIIFHLAAQPLVRQSYVDPVGTFETNVIGTLHLLEAVRESDSVRAVIIVTTDKVYDNQEWLWGYRENERLGGKDPYSASKACAELVSQSYMASYFAPESYNEHGVAIATVRAGNIIGGGDWSENRLVPDCLRAFEFSKPIKLRHPQAVRPWQHVLAPLDGYMILKQKLYEEGPAYQGAWNFGPYEQDVHSVYEVASMVYKLWGATGASISIETAPPAELKEAQLLKLDSSKARTRLGWKPRWSLPTALGKTIEWHQAYMRGDNLKQICLEQISQYEKEGSAE